MLRNAKNWRIICISQNKKVSFDFSKTTSEDNSTHHSEIDPNPISNQRNLYQVSKTARGSLNA